MTTTPTIADLADRFEAMLEVDRQATAALATIKATTADMSDDECEAYMVSSGARRLIDAMDAHGATFGDPEAGARLV